MFRPSIFPEDMGRYLTPFMARGIRQGMMIYGVGGVIAPFIGIKVIDMIIAPLLTMIGFGI